MNIVSLSRSQFHYAVPNGLKELDRYETRELTAAEISLIIAYSTLLVVGVCGNLWVISVIGWSLKESRYQRRTLGTPKALQIFILALCCCDLIVLTFLIFVITDIVYGQWLLPDSPSACRLFLWSESLNKFCCPFLLVALSGYCYGRVCGDRLQAWSYKISYLWSRFRRGRSDANSCWSRFSDATGEKRSLLAILICMILVSILIIPVYAYGEVRFVIALNETAVYSITAKCTFQPPEEVFTIFTVCTFLFGFVAPAFLFTFFYICILGRAWHQTRVRCERREENAENPCRKISVGKGGQTPSSYLCRVVKTTMGLVMFYLVCWTPYWTMSVYQYFTPLRQFSPDSTENGVLVVVAYYVIHMLPYINITGFPILYTMLNKGINDAHRRSRRLKHYRRTQKYMPRTNDSPALSSRPREFDASTAELKEATLSC